MQARVSPSRVCNVNTADCPGASPQTADRIRRCRIAGAMCQAFGGRDWVRPGITFQYASVFFAIEYRETDPVAFSISTGVCSAAEQNGRWSQM